jgi:hypothetical protein
MKSKVIYLLALGFFLGAASLGVVSLVSNRFEPFDNDRGLLLGQFLLAVPAFVIGYRYGTKEILSIVFGAYLGMNSYAFLLGTSEQRVWFILGLLTTLSLIAVPLIFGFAGRLTGVIRSRIKKVTAATNNRERGKTP